MRRYSSEVPNILADVTSEVSAEARWQTADLHLWTRIFQFASQQLGHPSVGRSGGQKITYLACFSQTAGSVTAAFRYL